MRQCPKSDRWGYDESGRASYDKSDGDGLNQPVGAGVSIHIRLSFTSGRPSA